MVFYQTSSGILAGGKGSWMILDDVIPRLEYILSLRTLVQQESNFTQHCEILKIHLYSTYTLTMMYGADCFMVCVR
jgi:hypothetical protein